MPSTLNNPILDLPVPATYVRILLQQAKVNARQLLRGSGLDARQLTGRDTLTVDQQLVVFTNAYALRPTPDWGLEFGRQLNINSHGPLGFAALSAPTLGEGLEVLSNFARIRAPYLAFTAERDNNWLRLTLRPLVTLGKLDTVLQECVLAIAESFVRAVLGQQSTDGRLRLAWPSPAHEQRYSRYFNGSYAFNAAVTAYELPLALCQLPCPLHDQYTYLSSLARCRDALTNLIHPGDATTRVRQLLAAHFERQLAGGDDSAAPQLDSIAALLSLTPRTLARRLAAQGSGFRELLEAAQGEAACQMLGDARYRVHEVGERLGYADAANFGRAFRRWTGLSPGQYRRRTAGKEASRRAGGSMTILRSREYRNRAG